MPIYKFRTFAEAEAHLRETRPDDALERMRRLQSLLSTLTVRNRIERGVFRFRTWEEAERHSETVRK